MSLPEAWIGCAIAVAQPNTRIENLNYRGPTGQGGVVHVDRGTDVSIQDASIVLNGSNPDSHEAIVTASTSRATVRDVTFTDEGERSSAGDSLCRADRPAGQHHGSRRARRVSGDRTRRPNRWSDPEPVRRELPRPERRWRRRGRGRGVHQSGRPLSDEPGSDAGSVGPSRRTHPARRDSDEGPASEAEDGRAATRSR